MHLILSSDTSILPKIKLSAFQHEDITSFYNMDPIGVLKEVNKMDFAPNELCNYLEEKQILPESVIIFSDNNLIGYNESIRLASHIRFHNFTSGLNKLPLTIVFDKIPNPIFDKSTMGTGEIQNFQYEEGFYFIDAADLSTALEDETGQLLTVFEKNFNETIKNKSFAAEQLETIKILPSKQMGNHEISNLWGAVSLARNAGFDDNEIGYQIPQTLYFKYLTRKHKTHSVSAMQRRQIVADAIKKMNLNVNPELFLENSKLTFSNHPYVINKRILLIDDNADKGWMSVIEKIFPGCNVVSKYDFEQVNQFGNLFEIRGYDLVFLDLRLPKLIGKQIAANYGLALLQKLKFENPEIPIIIFTASNKSWTMHEVIEMGADGIYVKESPEYAADPDYSIGNFNSFSNIVLSVLYKYHILRPYWVKIKEILSDETFQNLKEEKNTIFKKRIIERLQMFYGLLKGGFEQTKFNHDMFHFSDFELAYMTLWSTLNDISEANYNKTCPAIQLPGPNQKVIDKHPGGQKLKYLHGQYCWSIKNQNDVFVDYQYRFILSDNNTIATNKSGYYYKLESKQVSSFFLDGYSDTLPATKNTKVNYENTLFLQIAFLIFKKDAFSMSQNITLLINKLIQLNETRNKLYLTHGEQINDGFFSILEKDKRILKNYNITPTGDIKDLFELIAFLLTAKEIKLNF